jgi:hypothetical protein
MAAIKVKHHVLKAPRYYRGLRSLLFAMPVVISVIWTTLPSIEAAMGTIHVKFRIKSLLEEARSGIEIKRAIQKQFLYYDVYIPIEDILLREEVASGEQKLPGLIDRCGRGEVYVWVPYPVRLPILGEKLTEICQTF